MDEKKQFSVRLNAGLAEALLDYKDILEENGESIKSDKDMLESLIETASAKYRPFKDNSSKIKDLELANQNLQKSNDSLLLQVAQLKEKVSQLNTELTETQKTKLDVSAIKSDILLKTSNLNIVHVKLIEKYLKDKATLKMFLKLNENGKYNGFFDELTPNDTGKFLLNVFLAASLGKVLPAVVSNASIMAAIDKQVKSIDL